MFRSFSFCVFLSGFFSFSAAVQAADISGQVTFSGPVPEAQPLNMKTDPTCVKLQSSPAMNEEVIVNANGTLKNAFVYVKEGLEGKTFPVPSDAVQLIQEKCTYSPRVFGIQTAQTLEVINRDATLHNVRSMPEDQRGFNLGMPLKDMTVKKQFSSPEIMVPFKCDVHPWMRAYAGVLSHPFFSVTDSEGHFHISGLPEGEYVLEAWHEKYGTRTLSLTVQAGAEPEALEFRFSEI